MLRSLSLPPQRLCYNCVLTYPAFKWVLNIKLKSSCLRSLQPEPPSNLSLCAPNDCALPISIVATNIEKSSQCTNELYSVFDLYHRNKDHPNEKKSKTTFFFLCQTKRVGCQYLSFGRVINEGQGEGHRG